MSRRRLSDDEHTLWKGVTRSIAPLRKRRVEIPHVDETPAAPAAAKARTRPSAKPAPVFVPPPPTPKPAPPPGLEPLGRKLKKRVARGRHAIDGRLDLHGMTQAEAHDALAGFLRRAQANGASIVLVITGKGKLGEGSERGVLKRQVPMWLGQPEFRQCIIGFEAAAIGHGGEGALYVRLRRA